MLEDILINLVVVVGLSKLYVNRDMYSNLSCSYTFVDRGDVQILHRLHKYSDLVLLTLAALIQKDADGTAVTRKISVCENSIDTYFVKNQQCRDFILLVQVMLSIGVYEILV
jgi:hypothetical protein